MTNSYTHYDSIKSADDCWQKCVSDRKCLASSFANPELNWKSNCYLINDLDQNTLWGVDIRNDHTFMFQLNYGWKSHAFIVPLNLTNCAQKRSSNF